MCNLIFVVVGNNGVSGVIGGIFLVVFMIMC